MEHSEEISKLSTALAKAQGQFKPAIKDRNNPGFHFDYATLSSCWEAVRKPLSDNELCIVQAPGPVSGKNEIGIETWLMHTSGEWLKSTLVMPVPNLTAQEYGKAITYARRYSLMMVLGISSVEDDDDGNAASQQTVKQAPQPTQKAAPKREQEPPTPQVEQQAQPPVEIDEEQMKSNAVATFIERWKANKLPDDENYILYYAKRVLIAEKFYRPEDPMIPLNELGYQAMAKVAKAVNAFAAKLAKQGIVPGTETEFTGQPPVMVNANAEQG